MMNRNKLHWYREMYDITCSYLLYFRDSQSQAIVQTLAPTFDIDNSKILGTSVTQSNGPTSTSTTVAISIAAASQEEARRIEAS